MYKILLILFCIHSLNDTSDIIQKDVIISCSKSANVLFLIDTSSNIDTNTFNDLATQIIPRIIDTYESILSNFFLSILSYSDRINEIMPLQEVLDGNLLKDKLNLLEISNAQVNHINALEKSSSIFNDLTDKPNLCIWFSNSDFSDLVNIQSESFINRNSCILVAFNTLNDVILRNVT
ncbi:unnamed protein product [Brachionus calyciflorus]|uniref:VWFA domain-containing protein n=1 Tax=Brachionus calyciflorus TaxID=104777 RepID=A0A813UNB6_9BILA|nr:unnamed protein product [Brachionus calyciflorus]